jgi:hypothetical protein
MTEKRVTYDHELWEKIRKEWLAGQLSLSDMEKTYGPTRAAIRKKARGQDWPARGTLSDEVRSQIEERLLLDEVPAEVPPLEASKIVESATNRGVAVVRHHRDLLHRLLALAGGTLTELEEMAVISAETLRKRRTKGQAMLVSALAKAKFDGLRVVSQVLGQAIPLERQAHSIDKEGGREGGIKYYAPDYDKPKTSGLSEDDWEEEDDE